VSSLFAAFLGENPVQHLLAPFGVLPNLPAANQQTLTGRQFFPNLISGPVHHGLFVVFTAATVLAVLGALASLLRGGRYVHPGDTEPVGDLVPAEVAGAGSRNA
jgi:hypothetical protein